VETVVRVGGAQAIAAMAYGTETVPACDVIVGPGNRYVALAKREVSGLVHVESMAGPSEVAVVCDATTDPTYVALDVCAQAEHGPGGTAVVVTWDAAMVAAVQAALADAVAHAARADEIRSTLDGGGVIVLAPDAAAALAVVDALAPEHLEVMCAEPLGFAEQVTNAGAIFVGPTSPAALGDYAVGTNHVLPTGRAARYASALRVDDFLKHIHIVEVDDAGLAALAPTVRALAEAEGLVGHAASVEARLGRVTGATEGAQ
jgi:histidinol dehydrogenase